MRLARSSRQWGTTMYPSPCPRCSRLTAPLNAFSSPLVTYYCCEACRHIWVIDKKTGEVNNVTLLPPKPESPE